MKNIINVDYKSNINYNLIIAEQMFMKGWLFYGKYR